MVKPIELTAPFLKGPVAITLWPFILYSQETRDDKCVQVHEHYHWNQMVKWGVLLWYAVYLLLWAMYYHKKPANYHPLEKEAYRLEEECRKHA